jgi:hypothetical protein
VCGRTQNLQLVHPIPPTPVESLPYPIAGRSVAAMVRGRGRGRGRRDIDWYTVFLSYYSNDGAIDASTDSLAPAPNDGAIDASTDSLAPAPQAPTSPGSRQRSEEPRSEFERCFGVRSTGVQVDDGAPFRITRLAGKVRTHASSLLSLCNENEWWCLIVYACSMVFSSFPL